MALAGMSKVLALSMLFASVMVTGMRLFDAVTDPIIGALMEDVYKRQMCRSSTNAAMS